MRGTLRFRGTWIEKHFSTLFAMITKAEKSLPLLEMSAFN